MRIRTNGRMIIDQSDTVTITIEAVDAAGRSTVPEYDVHADTTAPVIAMQESGLQAPLAVNAVTTSPYVVSGTVVDSHFEQARIFDLINQRYDFKCIVGKFNRYGQFDSFNKSLSPI